MEHGNSAFKWMIFNHKVDDLQGNGKIRMRAEKGKDYLFDVIVMLGKHVAKRLHLAPGHRHFTIDMCESQAESLGIADLTFFKLV